MAYTDDETNDPRPRWHILWKCVLVGLVSGLFVTLYRFMITSSNDISHHIFSFLKENPLFIPLWIVAAAIAGYALHLLVKGIPEISGSGIPRP